MYYDNNMVNMRRRAPDFELLNLTGFIYVGQFCFRRRYYVYLFINFKKSKQITIYIIYQNRLFLAFNMTAN